MNNVILKNCLFGASKIVTVIKIVTKEVCVDVDLHSAGSWRFGNDLVGMF